ncbi:MAG: DUF2029 domain-containing protein [Lachnospiraceae bacterium]|nr:DUF2029 domain-containing protein [Lachnospiraceae bacterium]
MKKNVKSILYIILILLAVLSVFQGARNALRYSQDFQYDAALSLRSGINPYRESLEPTGALQKGSTALFYRIFEKAGAPQKMEANQFPSLLMLLMPMTFLPFPAARVMWLILNLVFTALSVLLLRQTFFKNADRDIFNLLMLLMIAGTPWRNQIGVGQHSLFSFFFFMLAVWLSENDHALLSGLTLSVSYFKYTLTAPLAVYFLYKKRYKELVISLIPHVIGTFAGAKMLHSTFIDMIREPLKVASVLSGEGSIDIGALCGGGPVSIAVTIVIMLVLVISVFLLPEGRDGALFSILILFSLIMTYHRIYDFFILIPAAAGTYLADPETVSHRLLLALYGIVVLYFFFVVRLLRESALCMKAGAFLYYIYLVMFVLFFVLSLRNRDSSLSPG